MIKYTLWSPDTCCCQIEYAWDDSVPIENRVHTCISIRKKCSYHQLADKHQHFDIILKENKMKNNIIDKFMIFIPSISNEIDIEGQKTKKLKNQKSIDWIFDNNRKLNLLIKGFTLDEKQQMQTLIDSEYPNQIILGE